MRDRAAVFALCLIVIIFCLTMLTTDILGGGALLPRESSAIANNVKTYYLVAVGGYETYALAKQDASLMRGMGAGGYILKSEQKYAVVLAHYSEASDAQTVAAATDGASVLELKIASVEVPDEYVSAVTEQLLSLPESLASDLYSLSQSLEKTQVNDGEVLLKLQGLYTKTNNIKLEFENLYANSKDDWRNACVALGDIASSSVTNIIDSYTDESKLLSDMRYYAVQQLISRSNFPSE